MKLLFVSQNQWSDKVVGETNRIQWYLQMRSLIGNRIFFAFKNYIAFIIFFYVYCWKFSAYSGPLVLIFFVNIIIVNLIHAKVASWFGPWPLKVFVTNFLGLNNPISKTEQSVTSIVPWVFPSGSSSPKWSFTFTEEKWQKGGEKTWPCTHACWQRELTKWRTHVIKTLKQQNCANVSVNKYFDNYQMR